MYPGDCQDPYLLDVPSWAKEAGKLTTATVLQLSFGLRPRCQQWDALLEDGHLEVSAVEKRHGREVSTSSR